LTPFFSFQGQPELVDDGTVDSRYDCSVCARVCQR